MVSGAVAETERLANRVINGPSDPPALHFEIGENGTPTGTLLPGRRSSKSWTPIPLARKGQTGRKGQVALDFDATGERREANSLVNDIRREVDL